MNEERIQTLRQIGVTLMLALLCLLLSAHASPAGTKEKVILDSDMVELFDDGVAMLMLANHPDIELLGVTVVTGNKWLEKGLAEGIRQIELAGLDIPIVAGARLPLRHGRKLAVSAPDNTGVPWSGYERQVFGIGAESYAGAFSDKDPGQGLPYPQEAWRSHYEEAYKTKPTREPLRDGRPGFEDKYRFAPDWLVEQANRYPGEITLVAIGPATNLHLAMMQDPAFASRIKRIVYMGGAVDVGGNATAAAEFNWWFDPDSARAAVRSPWGKKQSDEEKITQFVVPLDVCNKVKIAHGHYARIMALPNFPTGLKDIMAKNFGPGSFLANIADPKLGETWLVWDVISAAFLIGEVTGDSILLPFDKDTKKSGWFDRWLDVSVTYGPDFGRSNGYAVQGPLGTQKVRVINAIDQDKFWKLVYEGLSPAGR
jgi:inosine-uridine nucleoside N-ribohydrolase